MHLTDFYKGKSKTFEKQFSFRSVRIRANMPAAVKDVFCGASDSSCFSADYKTETAQETITVINCPGLGPGLFFMLSIHIKRTKTENATP